MFFAPPAQPRRKPRATPLRALTHHHTHDDERDADMGNTASDPAHRELFSTVAAKFLANTSDAQAVSLTGLLQSAHVLTAQVGAKKWKHQCRWCLETFDKK